MTTYTVRATGSGRAVSTHAELEDAVDALATEELAHHLNPDPSSPQVLDLVITAEHYDNHGDDQPPGLTVVLFAAGAPAYVRNDVEASEMTSDTMVRVELVTAWRRGRSTRMQHSFAFAFA